MLASLAKNPSNRLAELMARVAKLAALIRSVSNDLQNEPVQRLADPLLSTAELALDAAETILGRNGAHLT